MRYFRSKQNEKRKIIGIKGSVARQLNKRKQFKLKKGTALSAYIPFLACFALLVIFSAKLLAYGADSIETKNVNAEIRQVHSAEHFQNAPETTDVPVQSAEPAQSSTVTAAVTNSPHPQQTAEYNAGFITARYQYVGTNIREELRQLKKQNPDLTGWLNIPGIVDLPVVYRNNTYYLTHDFYGKKSPSGTLFLDANHPFKPLTQYLVIHGHNMKDGTMFGMLTHYRKLDYIKNHGIINFTTLYREEKYVIYAVLTVPENVTMPGYVPYVGTCRFTTPEQFQSLIDKFRTNSIYSIPVDVAPDDALLTLSTCLDDDRFIVAFRRVRDGESTYTLKNQLKQARKQ